MKMLLDVKDLTATYGQVVALRGLTFGLEEGSVTALLGANGAGKTTVLRSICNQVTRAGSILLDGKSLAGLPTERISRLGVAHVPQGRGTFTRMTVEENLRLGCITRHDADGIESDMARMYEQFPILHQRRTQGAALLSGGEQQMLAIARALMLKPRLLLLDEPSFGLAPMVVRDLFRVLQRVNQADKVTIFVVEQNAELALEIADQALLIDTGTIVKAGTAAELGADPDMRKSYLGY